MLSSAIRVHVAPVTPAMYDAVRALQVGPGQGAYAGDAAFNLTNAQDDPQSEAMAVIADGAVVGFYRLDFARNAIIGRDLGAPSVGLRAFLIDARQQGRGIGQRATVALCEDVRQRHPQRRLLLLLVHCRNLAGIVVYRKAGFIDTGKLFGGGRAGPQHLMLRPLPATAAAAVGQSADG